MRKSLREIAEFIDGVIEGDESVMIESVCGIKDAGPGQITFVASPQYLPLLATTRASAIIVAHDVPASDKNLIRTEHPYLAFTEVLKLFAVEPPRPKGIHPTAVIGKNVLLGKDVALHAGIVVEDDCNIENGSVLYPGVFVGSGTRIGCNCTIYPRVVIFHDTLVGNNVIIHSGAVIGSRPLPGPASPAGGPVEEPAGVAIIEDDVEIGAGVTINCARVGATVVGRGTKIDNLVHIGADSTVGCNCIIVSQASIGSYCKVGDGVTIAGQAGITGGVTVGNGTMIAGKAGVIEDIGENQIVGGIPAYSHDKWLRSLASIKRLPMIVRDIREFKRRLNLPKDLEDDKPEDD